MKASEKEKIEGWESGSRPGVAKPQVNLRNKGEQLQVFSVSALYSFKSWNSTSLVESAVCNHYYFDRLRHQNRFPSLQPLAPLTQILRQFSPNIDLLRPYPIHITISTQPEPSLSLYFPTITSSPNTMFSCLLHPLLLLLILLSVAIVVVVVILILILLLSLLLLSTINITTLWRVADHIHTVFILLNSFDNSFSPFSRWWKLLKKIFIMSKKWNARVSYSLNRQLLRRRWTSAGGNIYWSSVCFASVDGCCFILSYLPSHFLWSLD